MAAVTLTDSTAERLENTAIQMPDTAPALAFTGVTAFPGLNWTNPICLRTPPGETQRLFVAEKGGRIYVISDVTASNLDKVLFLDLASLVNPRPDEDFTQDGEGGLLSLDFHPDYANNGEFFVYYTVLINDGMGTFEVHDRLSRFQVSAGDPNAADIASEQPFFQQYDEASNHNGGGMHFGPVDGYLYLALGDEGGADDSFNNSQKIDQDFFSAMLRIDVDLEPEDYTLQDGTGSDDANLPPNAHPSIVLDGGGDPLYEVPADNPYVGATMFNGAPVNASAVRNEFFAVGLRNPWQWCFDPQTGEIILADVGQGDREEVDIIKSGKNYGWAFFEGTQLHTTPPMGFVGEPPIYEYSHGGGEFDGNAVTGGVVYYGTDPLTDIPELDGLYIFADYISGNVWSMDRSGSVTVNRLFGDTGIITFGYDPSNGDILYGDSSDGLVKRVTRITEDDNFPMTLTATGAFSELAGLTPNPGMLAYEPNVAFWSDHAKKRRWFTVPSPSDTITFSGEGNWSFPSGTVWVKHFDLEMERGDPSTGKRIETRVLVKNAGGCYGVSYHWNETGTEAHLVEDAGLNLAFDIDTDPGPGQSFEQQVYRIPSRAECLSCHTAAGGHALSFNTRQLNRTGNIGGILQNQIKTLSDAGYFSDTVTGINALPRFARADESGYSLEYRVRSYLSVNCVQCHQPGGNAPGSWDARAHIATEATALINGEAINNGGDPANKLIVPGSEATSILLHRLMASGGFGRMPNIGSNVLDTEAIQLVADWINLELPSRQSYAEWRIAHFGNGNSPEGEKTFDADGDGDSNYFEFLTSNDPNNAADRWSYSTEVLGGSISFSFERTANRGFQIEVSTDLAAWELWDVPGNDPFFGAGAVQENLSGPFNPGTRPRFFYRWVILEL